MKRLPSAATALALALALTVGAGAMVSSPSPDPFHQHGSLLAATDDPMPVECAFCGGDPLLHARRMSAIALLSTQLAYRVLDESIF